MENLLNLLKEATRLCEEKLNSEKKMAVENNDKVELSTVPVGGIIEANGNEYKVLEHLDNGTTCIISLDFMLEDVRFDSQSRDYKISNLKKEIDTKCLPVFEKDFGADSLVEHEMDLASVDMQNEFGKCKCKVRPITFDEARKYNDLLVNDALDDWWWTCTPWSTEARGWRFSIAVVSSSGFINNCDYDCIIGVRPICILKSNIFVSKKGE